jgi:hypothetical protein
VEGVEVTDNVEWIEVPQRRGGGAAYKRRAMATLFRSIARPESPYIEERLIVATTLFEAIGSPSRVEMVVDQKRGRFALRPSDVGRKIAPQKLRTGGTRMNAGGLSESLGLATRTGSVPMRAAVKDGMILMEPISEPQPCAACGGKGTK